MAAVIANGTNALTYTAGSDTTVNLTAASSQGSATAFTVTITPSAGLPVSIEVNTVLPGFGVYERTAIVLPVNGTISCSTPGTAVGFTLYGFN